MGFPVRCWNHVADAQIGRAVFAAQRQGGALALRPCGLARQHGIVGLGQRCQGLQRRQGSQTVFRRRSRQRRIRGPSHQRVEPGRRGKPLLLQRRGPLQQHGDLQPRLQHVLLHRLAHAVARLGDFSQLFQALAIARGDLERQSVIAVIEERGLGRGHQIALRPPCAKPPPPPRPCAPPRAARPKLVSQRHHLHKAEAPIAGGIVVLHLEGHSVAHPGKGERRVGQNAGLPHVGALRVDQGCGAAQRGVRREHLAHHVIQAKLSGSRCGRGRRLLRPSHRRQQKQAKQFLEHGSSLYAHKPMPI